MINQIELNHTFSNLVLDTCDSFDKVFLEILSTFKRETTQNKSTHRRRSVKKRVLKNFCKFYRKAAVLDSLFGKVAGLQVSKEYLRKSSSINRTNHDSYISKAMQKSIMKRSSLEKST